MINNEDTPIGLSTKQELNVRLLTLTSDEDKFVTLKAEPNMATLGKRMGKNAKPVADAIRGTPPCERGSTSGWVGYG